MQPILEKGNQRSPETQAEHKKPITVKTSGLQKEMAKGLHKKKSSVIYKKSTEGMSMNQELKYFSEKKKSSPNRTIIGERNKQLAMKEQSLPMRTNNQPVKRDMRKQRSVTMTLQNSIQNV